MSAVGPYRYEGYDLPTKHSWVDGSPGLSAVAPTVDALHGVNSELGRISTEADNSMRKLGLAWTGPASDAAAQTTAQAGRSRATTQDLTANGANQVESYGESFEWLRPLIAYNDPSTYSLPQRAADQLSEAWQTVWASGSDHVTIGEQNQAHDGIANAALRTHEQNTARNDDAFTTQASATPATGVEQRTATSTSPATGSHTTPAVTGPGGAAPHVAPAAAPAPVVGGSAQPVSPPPGPAPGGQAPGGGPVGPGAVVVPPDTSTGTGTGAGTGAGSRGTPGATGVPEGPATVTAGTGQRAAQPGGVAGDPIPLGPGAGQRFGDALGQRALGSPLLGGPGAVAGDVPGAGEGALVGRGSGTGSGYGYGAGSGPGSRGYGGEPGTRGGGAGEPTARSGLATSTAAGRTTGTGGMVPPMLGSGRTGTDSRHRNRYPTPDDSFTVDDLPHTTPVLSPADDPDNPDPAWSGPYSSDDINGYDWYDGTDGFSGYRGPAR